ncbi:hypothetical protein [Crenobacter cavernae]|uniref:hypothetical protein n=1 Tax=Crenobacter cavernae TaxID=2290923 RepID=UPI0011C030E5|nr:hypothetical protein [Crenobacter cavernae]
MKVRTGVANMQPVLFFCFYMKINCLLPVFGAAATMGGGEGVTFLYFHNARFIVPPETGPAFAGGEEKPAVMQTALPKRVTFRLTSKRKWR